jgi:hypothetical protein
LEERRLLLLFFLLDIETLLLFLEGLPFFV